MNYYIYLIGVLLFGFSLRFYLLYKYRWVGKDTFYHLIVAKTIKNKGFPPKTIDQFIKPEVYDYPPFLHLILSFFDEKYYQKLQYISPFLDIMSGFVIFIFCSHYFNIEVALISTTLYVVTPFVLDNSHSLNPRSIANLFLIMSLFSFFNFFMSMNYFWFIFSIICSVIILLLHRLTTQCLFFILLSLSVGLKSLFPLSIIILSFCLTIIITKGFYLDVMKGHFAFIHEFGKKLINKEYKNERQKMFPDVRYVIFNLPQILFIPVFFIGTIEYSEISSFLLIWVLSLTILSIIWIFGEGIRHMICAVPAISIIFSYYFVKYNLYFFMTLMVLISILFMTYKIYRMEKIPSNSGIITKDMVDVFDFININKNESDIILCLPLDYTYNVAYFTNCIMLQSSGGFAEGLSFNQNLNYKINNGGIAEVINMYHPNWIIDFNKSSIFITPNLNFLKLVKIKEIGGITIYSNRTYHTDIDL